MSKDKQPKIVEEDIIDMEEESINEVVVSVKQQVQEIVPLNQMMDMASTLSKSTIVPIQYQNRPENVLIALDMANRMGTSPFVIMQQMYIVQGKPSFSGQFVAMIVQNNPRFQEVELIYVGEERTDSWGAYVQAVNIKTGKVLKGTTVTIAMAKAEGWFQKSGSKWQTIPEQMLGYRAYTYFGRLYAPAELMGMMSSDEMEDITKPLTQVVNPYGN